MAKTPSARVSKTSGQGVSRLSYQKSRALSGKTGGASTGIDASFGSSDLGGGDRGRNRYAKGGLGAGAAGGMNVSYGDTLGPTDLSDVKALGEAPLPKAGPALKSAKPKKWMK